MGSITISGRQKWKTPVKIDNCLVSSSGSGSRSVNSSNNISHSSTDYICRSSSGSSQNTKTHFKSLKKNHLINVFGKTLSGGVKWVTVRIPITQLAPGGFRRDDKARKTLDPCNQKHTERQVKPEHARFTRTCRYYT